MADIIESRDCSLPAFSHSVPTRPAAGTDAANGMIVCGSFMITRIEKNGEAALSAMNLSTFTGKSLERSPEASLSAAVSDSSISQPVSLGMSFSQTTNLLASNGLDSFVVSAGSLLNMYRVSASGAIDIVFSLDAPEPPIAATYTAANVVVVVSESGQGYRLDDCSANFPESFASGLTRKIARLDESSILMATKRSFRRINIESGETTKVKLGGVPDDLLMDDMVIQGVCCVGPKKFAIVVLTEQGLNYILLTASFSSTDQVICEHYSLNEVFVNNWTEKSFAILNFIPEFQILLAGHSLADSVGVFRITEDPPICVLLPEGKQLSCSPVDGDTSSCLLRNVVACVLTEPVKVPAGNELIECRLAVITAQCDGWITVHYGDLPAEWRFRPREPLPTVESDRLTQESIQSEAESESHAATCSSSIFATFDSTPAEPAETLTGAPADKPSEVTPPSAAAPGLFDASLKPPSAGAPGLFDASVMPQSAGTPGLFDASVKPPSAGAPGLFDSSVKPPPAAAPGLFDASVKPPSAGAPGLFDASIKPPSASAPGLFDASVKAPSAGAPGLFDASVKAPSAGAPGLFDSSVKPPPAGAPGPGLFGAFGAAPAPAASGSLFGQTTSATPAAPVPPAFDASLKPPTAIAPAEPKTGGLFAVQPATQSKSLFGAFGASPAPSQPVGGGLFGSSSFGQPVTPVKKEQAPVPPMFDASVKPPAALVERKEAPPADIKSGGLFATQATAPATSLFGAFGASPAPSQPVGGGLFGSSSFGQPVTPVKKEQAPVPPMFDASVKPPAALVERKEAPPADIKSGGLFATQATAPATSLFGAFGASPAPSQPASGGLFGSSSFGQSGTPVTPVTKESAPVPPMFDGSVKPPSASTIDLQEKTVESVVAKSGVSGLDESIVEAFEKELDAWETAMAGFKKPVPKFDDGTLPGSLILRLDSQKSELQNMREEIRRFDSDIREIYTSDASSGSSDAVTKLEQKHSEIAERLDEICSKSKRVISRTRRSATSASRPTTPTTPSVPLFHPLPPSLRKDGTGGFGMVTPVKAKRAQDGLSDLLAERRDPYTTRLALAASRQAATGKRMSLGDLLTGKILSSPSTPEKKAPTVIADGGHGAAWQLMRQVEQQRKELDALLREIESLQK